MQIPPNYGKSHFLHVGIDELYLVDSSRGVKSVVKNYVNTLKSTVATDR